MSPQDLLNRLPSLNELVDHPRVKRAVDQWNRSEALARVRAAVHDLGSEVARRAEDLGAKTPADLLERLVERLDRRSPDAPSTVINATGELWGGDWRHPPLADIALDSMCRAGWAYSRVGANSLTLRELTGAEASHVFATPAAALLAALQALSDGKSSSTGDVICAKAEAADPAVGCTLAELARRADLNLVEVGGPSGATLADYEQAFANSPQPLAVLRRTADFFRVQGGEAAPTFADLASLAKKSHTPLIAELGGASPIPLPLDLGVDSPSAKQAIEEGASLVVLSGVGLTSGPVCGMLMGRSTLVDDAARSSTGAIAAAPPTTLAALEATLGLFADVEQLRFVHPILKRIDTPLANLQSRAERLAPQIDASPYIDHAEAVMLPADEAVGPLGVVRLPSWGIAIESKSLDKLRTTLQQGEPAVHPRAVSIRERLVLDLRTVAPADDTVLVARFASPSTEAHSEPE